MHMKFISLFVNEIEQHFKGLLFKMFSLHQLQHTAMNTGIVGT